MDRTSELLDCYTGIGSRETPRLVQELMFSIAMALAGHGYILRSGAAPGADIAFERGCDYVQGTKEIFLPWANFQNRSLRSGVQLVPEEVKSEASTIASAYHPNWAYLKYGSKALHTRNVLQILGKDLNSPSKFVICWTFNGSGQGGNWTSFKDS